MNTNSTKLSLKLPPEVAKIMPWIIQTKASGKPNLTDWAKEEYERASNIAHERERWERELEERRRERELWLRLERERCEREERAERQYHAWLKQKERWAQLGIHFADEEDGTECIQPTHSSQKGWRRLLSECPDLQESGRYSMWGGRRDRFRSNQRYSSKDQYRGHSHNCGRKPRKPWYKKTRAQH